jgi:hypothetical protein
MINNLTITIPACPTLTVVGIRNTTCSPARSKGRAVTVPLAGIISLPSRVPSSMLWVPLAYWIYFAVLITPLLCAGQFMSAPRLVPLMTSSLFARHIVSAPHLLTCLAVLMTLLLCSRQEVNIPRSLALVCCSHDSLALLSTGSESSSLANSLSLPS